MYRRAVCPRVTDRVEDGLRIARLLSSELVAREDGPLAALELDDVRDADALDPGEFGAFAYGVAVDGDRLADVYVHDDRARVEFRCGVEAVPGAAAGEAGLRARPKAVEPPWTLVFIVDGAAVKRALDVVAAALAAAEDGGAADAGG
jgi:hypothetical protein